MLNKQYLRDKRDEKEQSLRRQRIENLLKQEEELCLKRMQDYEHKMSDVIGRSRRILESKIRRMEHQNKQISDRVKQANQNSHKELMQSMKQMANKEEKIYNKIISKDHSIDKLKRQQKKENDEKFKCRLFLLLYRYAFLVHNLISFSFPNEQADGGGK